MSVKGPQKSLLSFNPPHWMIPLPLIDNVIETSNEARWVLSLQWRLNKHDGVSNNQRLNYLLNRLFRPRTQKTWKLHPLAFVRGIHRWPANSPHKGPVTRKILPFDDVIISWLSTWLYWAIWPSCWRNNSHVKLPFEYLQYLSCIHNQVTISLLIIKLL